MKRPRASRRTMGASSGKGEGSGCEDAASLIGLPGSSVGCFLTLCVCEHLSEGFAASPARRAPSTSRPREAQPWAVVSYRAQH